MRAIHINASRFIDLFHLHSRHIGIKPLYYPKNILTRPMCTLKANNISTSPPNTAQEHRHSLHRHQHATTNNTSCPPNPGFTCPACGQRCYRPIVLQRHIFKCCPDIVSTDKWNQAATENDTIRTYLNTLEQQELVLRQRALDIAFRQRDADGNPLKLGPEEVSQALNLPISRAQRLISKGMSSIPLVADTEWPVEIVYEDEDLVAINKEPGVITAPKHRFMGGSLVNRIKGMLGFEPAVLHRLDMDTSGVILFGRARDIVPAVHAAFRDKRIHKEYLAVVVGVPEWTELTVDAAIDRNEHDKIARKVVVDGGTDDDDDDVGGEQQQRRNSKGAATTTTTATVSKDSSSLSSSKEEEEITNKESAGAKPAVTRFKVLATVPSADLSPGTPCRWTPTSAASITQGASLISCLPLTGRTHQIRVHLGHVGHPIVGDDLYGIEGPWLTRQALHAYKIRLAHPRSGEELEIVAPLAEDIRGAMRMLGFEDDVVK